jgi:hypothetical protein
MISQRTITKKWSAVLERDKKARALMARRTAPDEKESVFSLGYNKATAYWGRESMPRLNGSSLNRKTANKKAAYEKVITKSVSWSEGNVVDSCAAIRKHKESKSKTRVVRDASTNQRQIELRRSTSEVVRDMPIFKHSSRTKSKIKDKFTAFFKSSEGENTLVTLSFISKVEDKPAVAVLNKFLTALRSEKKFDYIWVAERQKNGNIHFHVLMNRRINVTRGNPLWVLQQYNAGIVHEKYSHEEILDRFKKGTIGEILNPFDIRSVNSIDGLSLYLTKYLCKSSDEFHCRVWHCSRGVSRLFTKALVSRSTFLQTGTVRNSYVDRTTGELFSSQTFVSPYAIVRYILNKKYFAGYLNELEQVNKWILGNELPNLQVPEISMYEYHKLYLNH